LPDKFGQFRALARAGASSRAARTTPIDFAPLPIPRFASGSEPQAAGSGFA
jgi:hypothetical protein